MHQAFHAERRYVELNMCPCGSCTQTNGLKLKFVAHVGEVATQTIRKRQKLVGVDVIYVHRLLKNPVQLPEYLLRLRRAARRRRPSLLVTQALALDLEGIGPVRTHVIDVDRPGAGSPARGPLLGRAASAAPSRWSGAGCRTRSAAVGPSSAPPRAERAVSSPPGPSGPTAAVSSRACTEPRALGRRGEPDDDHRPAVGVDPAVRPG